MDIFVEQLKSKKVIDQTDVLKFKNYIYGKYTKNTPIENAKILSNTIHRIIYNSLEGLPEDLKSSIKINTLKNTFGSNKDVITLYDIFNSFITDEDLINNFTDQLLEWVNIHIENKVNLEELNLYLKKDYTKPLANEEDVSSIQIQNNLNNNENTNDLCTEVIVSKDNISINYKKVSICLCILTAMFCIIIKFLSFNTIIKDKPLKETTVVKIDKKEPVAVSFNFPNSHLPEYMKYKSVDEYKLKEFLQNRNSILSTEPYFSTIFSTAREFNLNPIVFFAITGQEQGFVPKDTGNSDKIANNPFNVFHSWKEYNTDIKDSSRIAARTIINLSKDMPQNENPFLWIGTRYAEDKNWGKGVETIFKELELYLYK